MALLIACLTIQHPFPMEALVQVGIETAFESTFWPSPVETQAPFERDFWTTTEIFFKHTPLFILMPEKTVLLDAEQDDR